MRFAGHPSVARPIIGGAQDDREQLVLLLHWAEAERAQAERAATDTWHYYAVERSSAARAEYVTCAQRRADVTASTAFIEDEVRAITEADLADWFATSPELAALRPFITRIRRTGRANSYTASATERGAISATAMWRAVTADTDRSVSMANFGTPERADSNVSNALIHGDRTERRRCYQVLEREVDHRRQSLAVLLAGAVQQTVRLAQLRGYDTAVEAALAAQDLPADLADSLVAAAHSQAGFLQQLLGITASELDAGQLQAWDLLAQAAPAPALASIDDAWQLLLTALAPLGKSYAADLRRARDEGWLVLDSPLALPGPGVTRAAWGTPTILLQWDATMLTALRLAHELGHAIHRFRVTSSQRYLDADLSRGLSEVTPILHELMVAQYLATNGKTGQQRHFGRSYRAGCLRTNFFQAAAMLDFQLRIHRLVESGRQLTLTMIVSCQVSVLRRLYGSHVAVTDTGLGMSWARQVQNFTGYRSWEYVLGTVVALALLRRLEIRPAQTTSELLDVVSAGSSTPATELLRRLGIDVEATDVVATTSDLLASDAARWRQAPLEPERLVVS